MRRSRGTNVRVERRRRADERWMRRAIELARRGLGRVSPNPPVGAVVVKRGRVIGEGRHRRAGGPHAEVFALRAAGAAARGATLYLTLEPCTVVGRTPACAPAVITSGVTRVVIAGTDPNPRVRGRGIRRLRQAGLDVTTGVLADEAAVLVEWFGHFMTRHRPAVLLKLAASLDGRIATASGESRWLSGPSARRWVHELRNRVDAVMVGAGTILADDPALTCRMRGGRDPLRIVVDGALRISPRARVFRQASSAPTVVVTTTRAPARRVRALEQAGAEVLRLDGRGGRIRIATLLDALGARGVTSVLLEGGGDLAAGALRERVVDRLLLVMTPRLLGGDAKSMLGPLGLPRLAAAPRVRAREVRRLGADLLLDGAVQY